ncbi:MAG TPA: LysM peptidoglycan-binding domain-containing protein [Nocardioidaceae bacterium]|nr:LysM peptidoglycan-binding domain-containing protein [Nocardioidaceae bacterium]
MKPYVTFRQVDPKGGSSVRAELGNGYATPAATGGWQVVSRPRRVGMTDYQGPDPVTQDVPIVLDGTRTGASQEALISRLYQMMRTKVGPRKEPPVIEVTGVPIPFHGARWVINGITPGDEIRRERDGHRIQAAMTISLLEYVGGNVIIRGGSTKAAKAKHTSPAKKSAAKSKTTGKTSTWVVKAGDTLSGIAAKEYGDASEWHRIATANNIRDPRSLKIGTKLKIPAG